MSSRGTGAVLGPITLSIGGDPAEMGMTTAISSAFAYLTVVGTPACTIVYAAGYLRATDFLTVGWKMCIVSILVMLSAAYLYWPLVESYIGASN